MLNDPNSGIRKLLPIILLTSLFTAIILLVIFGIGLYLFFPKNAPEQGSEGSRVDPESKPTPFKQTKKPSPIKPSAISKVEYRESDLQTNRPPDSMRFLGNVDSENNVDKSLVVTLFSDGTAQRVSREQKTINGKKMRATVKRSEGSFPQKDFQKLASALVENDFLNTEDSKNVTSLPWKKELVIFYSASMVSIVNSEKRIELGHDGEEKPGLQAILDAFRRLEKETKWEQDK